LIEIGNGIFISDRDLVFKFSRSSGPGGQNVNKVNSRAVLLFDVANCTSFSEVQKERIFKHLASRANRDGVISIVSQQYRTQKGNRDAAVERLKELLKEALKEKRLRKKTVVPGRIRQKRLVEKRKRSILKKQRGGRDLTADSADWN
jgi:ribosome-associated protein